MFELLEHIENQYISTASKVGLMRLNEVCMLDLVDRVATRIYGKIY